MRTTTTRRGFLTRAAAIGAGALAAPAIFHRGFLGAASPNEKIITGHIGVGGMGSGHLNNFKDNCGAICDISNSASLSGCAVSAISLRSTARLVAIFHLPKLFSHRPDQFQLLGIETAQVSKQRG